MVLKARAHETPHEKTMDPTASWSLSLCRSSYSTCVAKVKITILGKLGPLDAEPSPEEKKEKKEKARLIVTFHHLLIFFEAFSSRFAAYAATLLLKGKQVDLLDAPPEYAPCWQQLQAEQDGGADDQRDHKRAFLGDGGWAKEPAGAHHRRRTLEANAITIIYMMISLIVRFIGKVLFAC